MNAIPSRSCEMFSYNLRDVDHLRSSTERSLMGVKIVTRMPSL